MEVIEWRCLFNPVEGFFKLYATVPAKDNTPALHGRPMGVVDSPPDWPEGINRQPCLELVPEAAQNLFDSMWNAGLRPSLSENTQGGLEQLRDKLSDCRLYYGTPAPGDTDNRNAIAKDSLDAAEAAKYGFTFPEWAALEPYSRNQYRKEAKVPRWEQE